MTHRDADTTPRSTESSEGANGASAQNAQSNNQTNSQSNNSATTTPKRPRRAPSRTAGKKQTQSTQAAPVAQAPAPVSEPAAHQSAQSAHEAHQAAAQATQPTHQPAQTPATEAAPAKSSRTHRGGRSSRRRSGAVTIVVPPAPEAATEEAASVAHEVDSSPAATAPDAELTGTAQPQTVPASEVRAEERAASTPATFESPATEAELAAATAEPAWSPTSLTGESGASPAATSGPTAAAAAPATATPPTSRTRYRFERRSPVVASQPAATARPERLSGRFTASLPGAAGTAFPTMEAEIELQQAETATPAAREPQAAAPQAAAHAAAPEAVTPEVHLTRPTVPGTAPVETTESETALTSQLASGQPGEDHEAVAEHEGHESHEATTRRRRRRRRTGAATEAQAEEGESTSNIAGEIAAAGRESGNGFEASYPGGELESAYLPYAPYTPEPPTTPRPAVEHQPTQYPPYTPGGEPGWNITQGQQQIRQTGSPFGSPEPSFAEGFGPQPRGVAQPYRESLARTTRTEREAPPISTNQLAQVIGAAFQQQTDRLIAELRRQMTTPPTITVAMPPAQSTERVGVFVDVANLYYSSRNMRMSIDFGHLLDFLRGNRRLIRAHAYAPTSPEPHAAQEFLSLVKGVGYRITTKNYKTFSSGAKKADLDLDICMDIVRLVEGDAIDTVVLVSGDSDFLPVLEWASDKGVRIEVAAFEDAASAILRQSCDLFVNLSLVPDIRM